MSFPVTKHEFGNSFQFSRYETASQLISLLVFGFVPNSLSRLRFDDVAGGLSQSRGGGLACTRAIAAYQHQVILTAEFVEQHVFENVSVKVAG